MKQSNADHAAPAPADGGAAAGAAQAAMALLATGAADAAGATVATGATVAVVATVAVDAVDAAGTVGPVGSADAAAADALDTAAAPAAAKPTATSAQQQRHAAWLQRVAAEPWRFDFYQTLRRLEAAHPELPRLGEAARPSDEPVRVAQPADLSFAPASLAALQLLPGGVPLLQQRIFGLVGPNGPLPTHLTELTRERARHHGDQGLQRFLDMLTHRFALLFYRAWAQAQPATSLDRHGDTRFVRRIGALAGLGSEPLLERDAAGDAAKLHFTGRLSRHVRDAEGLLAWCRSQFSAPVQVLQWCGHWMPLGRDERSRLGAVGRGGSQGQGQGQGQGQALGQGAVLGAAVWDVQHKFRIVIGPLPLARYLAFLPGGRDLGRLQAIVRQWIGLELEWDLRLILAADQVPHLGLAHRTTGTGAKLGRTAWLGTPQRKADAQDLTIDVERTLRPRQHQRQRTSALPPHLSPAT